MKKILFLIFAVLVLGFTFVACSDDDEKNPRVGTNPGGDAAGTYSGIYTRVLDEDTVTATGKVIITASDASAYSANIEFIADSAIWDNDQLVSSMNITYANDGFQFHNQSTANGMGTAFSGSIDAQGNINSYFKLTVRVGRVNNDYNYYFEGKKD